MQSACSNPRSPQRGNRTLELEACIFAAPVPILDRPKGAIAHSLISLPEHSTTVPILDRPKGAIARVADRLDRLADAMVPILDRPKGAIAQRPL